MTEKMIEAEGLRRVYRNRKEEIEAVRGVDFTVDAGEIVGFLGPNGAGKTTTIRALLDLIHPTSGRATILGMDTHESAVEIRRHIGYLPADLALYPNLTGRETLTYFANLRGGVDWSHVDQLAERFDADLTRKVSEYSSGNRQKVGLIQAFMNKPEVLILDEPSAGLDPLVQEELQSLFRETADEGRTVFLSSHALSEVERAAHRVGIIRLGRLAVVETIESLKTKAIRRLEMVFAAPVDASVFKGVDGVRSVDSEGDVVSVSFEGPMAGLLHVAMGHDLINLHSAEADLEEIFLTYYREGAGGETV